MAIALSSSIDYKDDDRTRYLDKDNIVNITKESLKSLKSKVDFPSDIDANIKRINKIVEDRFDGTLLNDRNKPVTLNVNNIQITDTMKNIVMSGNQAKLDALAQYTVSKSGFLLEVNTIKDEEIKAELKKYKFELHDLRKNIQASSTGSESGVSDSNVWLLDYVDKTQETTPEGTTEETEETAAVAKEKYFSKLNYIDRYRESMYASVGKDDNIENIYSDRNVRNAMKNILDNTEQESLRKGTFKINLGKENGLAGIIIAIREAANFKKNHEKDRDDLEESNPNYKYKEIEELFSIDDTGAIALGDNKKSMEKSLDKLIKKGVLKYKRGGGLDNETGKIAKILTTATRKNLDTFAGLVQSKSDVEMAVKEWNNALVMTGNGKGKEKNKNNKEYRERISKINSGNVLEFLCDFNGDGAIAIERNENQGDVGTLFGQQVMFTLEQAIGVKEVELGKGKGERLVIGNILKNMKITDRRSLTKEQTKFLDAMILDEALCTKQNLTKLINGYTDKEGNHIDGMPEFKIFFLDAIKTINGGSSEVQPDLYETFVGDDAKAILDVKEEKTSLKITLDNRLRDMKGIEDEEDRKALKQLIEENGVVEVRETIFLKIMTILDNVTITTNNGAKTQLQAAGITKGRAARNAQKEFLRATVKKLVNGGIHYSREGGLRLSLGVGAFGTSESGRTKRSRGADGGLIVGPQGVELFIGLAGEIAEQYNHARVINADLSQVKNAQYLGLEGNAAASISVTDGSGIEVSGGINWQQDPVVGINQIDKQYRRITEELFDVHGISFEDMSNKELFRSHITDRINSYQGGRYKKFIENNKQHLSDDLENIVNYMDINKFFGPEGKIAQLPDNDEDYNKTDAINTLIDIMQSGNIEQRRNNVIAGLHGRSMLTKLSFGVTTNIFTLKLPKSTKRAPNASATAGDIPEAGNINSGGTGSEVALGQEKFGIFGFYVGARISTWKNRYVPNEQQYLYTQYEIGEGIGTETIETKDGKLDKYSKYLTALYNVFPKQKLRCNIENGKLVIKLHTSQAHPNLQEFLNIHATQEAMQNFSLKNNVLTIGNVGEIGAYTITAANGINRILCLGSKKVDEATRIIEDTDAVQFDGIESKKTGKKEWTPEKIQSTVIATMKGADQQAASPEIQTTTKSFFDKEGKLTTPEGTITTFEGASEGQKLTTGTLTIIKTADKTYTVKLDTVTSTEKLTIIYRDKKEYDAARLVVQENPANYEITSVSAEKLFAPEINSEIADVEQLINGLAESIKDLDKSAKGKRNYLLFLSKASSIMDGDGAINDREITAAIEHLRDLLPNSTSQLNKLHNYFTSLNWDTKTYIVDRLKQVFAKDALYSKSTLSQILKAHSPGKKWESITGPSGERIPKVLLDELRKQRTTRTQSKEYYNDNPKTYQNLIGYTGFYRYMTGNQYKNQKYSLTSLGNTSSQVELYPINDNNKDLAKNWFLKNLEQNTYEIDYLAKQLERQIAAKGVTVSLLKNTPGETFKIIRSLLSGDTVMLDSGVKISIDALPVFYLLGECANESLGIAINKINITKLKDNIPIAGEYIGSGIPDDGYEMGISLHAKSHSITSEPIPQELRTGLNHHRNKKAAPRSNGAAGNAKGSYTDQAGNIQSGGGEIE